MVDQKEALFSSSADSLILKGRKGKRNGNRKKKNSQSSSPSLDAFYSQLDSPEEESVLPAALCSESGDLLGPAALFALKVLMLPDEEQVQSTVAVLDHLFAINKSMYVNYIMDVFGQSFYVLLDD